jgi:hypothetical protein
VARARNIKPKFFQNEELAEVPALGRLLFIGLWTICDFRGCLEYRPKRIRAQLLPYDECDTESLLNNLEKSGFIQIYSVMGQRYIKIVTFERHQTPHKNERDAGTDLPDITEKDPEIKDLNGIEKNPDKDGTTRASSLFPLPDTPILNPDTPKPDSGQAIVVHADDPESKESKVEKKMAIIKRIFAYWQEVMCTDSAMDAKRQGYIEKALKNYSPENVCEAIRGCAMTPHNMGINERNTKYNGLNVILKDADNIDRFIRTARANPNGAKVGTEQTEEERLVEIRAALDRMNGYPSAPSDDPNIIDMEMPDA